MYNIILNIIFAFIISYIIYVYLLNNSNIHGPNSKDIINKVYEKNGKKYIFEPFICSSI